MGMIINPFWFGDAGPVGPIILGSALRAEKTSTQNLLSSGKILITFQQEVMDTDAAFASSVFTVPPGMDGNIAVIIAGCTRQISTDLDAYIDVDTGGGYVTKVRSDANDKRSTQISTGPVLLNDGDLWRLSVDQSSATIAGTATDTPVFFSVMEIS